VLDEPGYRDLVVPGIEGTVKLRSIEAMTPSGVEPALTFRLERDNALVGQDDLALGDTVVVADYEVTLEQYGYWQSIVLVRQHGVEAVMLGTLLVMLGSITFYLFPHVRLFVLADADGHRVIVGGSRLARSAMKDRIDSILKECA
jgi:hypothetical protein